MSAPSPLREAIGPYLELRRSLGPKLRHETWLLPSLCDFLEQEGSELITADLAVRWAQLPKDTLARWRVKRLTAVRGFARFVRARDPRHEVPPPGLIPCGPTRRKTPHIYSTDEVQALLEQASLLRQPLMAATYRTLIGLLAITGMRVGEAIALDDGDIDWLRGRLLIRDSKFGKSRRLPLHPSTLDALEAYAQLRPPIRRDDSFFVSLNGTRLHYANVNRNFVTFRTKAGIATATGRRAFLHDLRHTFAVSTLVQWYRAGVDVQRRLPVLSTWLGHVCPTTTYWYLTATPELLGLARQRADVTWEVL